MLEKNCYSRAREIDSILELIKLSKCMYRYPEEWLICVLKHRKEEMFCDKTRIRLK